MLLVEFRLVSGLLCHGAGAGAADAMAASEVLRGSRVVVVMLLPPAWVRWGGR